MNYFCLGLSRTGTLSLTEAMKILGFSTLHWSPERLREVILHKKEINNWRIYDDVDFVSDIPAAIFYREILSQYSNCKTILTIRNENEWYKSVCKHYKIVNSRLSGLLLKESLITQKYIYGSENPSSFLYKKKFRDHNDDVLRLFPNTLVMNICEGENWEKLCNFLNLPIPSVPFPHKNNSKNKIY